MPNHNFLTCAKAEIKDLTVNLHCGKWRKISKLLHDLKLDRFDLDKTMSNVQLFISISDNIFKFQVE